MMKDFINIVCIGLLLFLASCSSKTEKQLTGKKWYLYGVGISFFDKDGIEGEHNYQFYKKSRGISNHWTFTPAGNYIIVENGKAAGGKWQLIQDTHLKFTEIPNNTIKKFDILELSLKELKLGYKLDDNGQIASIIMLFKPGFDDWPEDEEIDMLNGDNTMLK
ncbi:MAG: hypothetical protein LBL90_02505 [Prevotellaceae bacterium]|jgi:hypothetical protein|nr:hypothetical protein [Prevotellaceae bacterium]